MSVGAYLFLEAATVALFGMLLLHAARRGVRPLIELLTAAVYGVALEWGDILLFGTYSYSPHFFLAAGPVPIVIGLCWGMIIYGAMRYSDQLGLPVWAAPFADAIWAIVLDLAFDAIAIRLEIGTWRIPLHDGYFGVPAGNFNAWLYVALGFSAWTRWARARESVRLQLWAPITAYTGLIVAIKFFDLLVLILYPANQPGDKGMAIFAATLAIFAAIVGRCVWRGQIRPSGGIDLAPTLARWAMHGYFGAWLILWIMVPGLRLPGMDAPPLLLVVAAGTLLVEVLLLVPLLRSEHRLQPLVTRVLRRSH